MLKKTLLAGCLAVALSATVAGQVHKYFSNGTVWTVTTIRIASGMDQMYMQYLDGQFKKSEDAQIKAGFQKSYKILRTMDDGGTWNLMILREYASLASLEANEENRVAYIGKAPAQMMKNSTACRHSARRDYNRRSLMR